ncbi:MAG: FG-GAP repeat protein, partial [bacterium]
MRQPECRSIFTVIARKSASVRMPAFGFAALLGLALFLSPSFLHGQIYGQTIYDLGEINGDLRILGDQEDDYIGIPNTVRVTDFNNNGRNDLLLIQGNSSGSIFGLFDVDFKQSNSFIDMRYSKPDLYIPFNISAHFAFNRLFSLDLNGDGIDDLVASSWNSYSAGSSSKVFVIYGSSDWVPPITIDLASESADLTILYGNSEDVHFGGSLASGDLNNDGIEDLIIGAWDAANPEGSHKGSVYVVFGSTNFPPSGTINFGKEPADLTFYGGGGNDDFGYDVAAGDVNGDGIDDVIVGAVRVNYDHVGRIYVFFGSNDFPPGHAVDLTYESADITIISPHEYARFGVSVSSGDINGDGIDDICGGSP